MLTYSTTPLLFGKVDSSISLIFDGAVWLIIELNMCVFLVAQSYLIFAIPWTIDCQAPLSMGFSRQEYWSGLPFPHLRDLPVQGSNLCVLHLLHCRCILWPLSHWGVCVKAVQLCPTLCNPMGYTVYVILQPRILEWVIFPFSWGSFQPRDWTQVSHIAGRLFTNWATRWLSCMVGVAHWVLHIHIYIKLF